MPASGVRISRSRLPRTDLELIVPPPIVIDLRAAVERQKMAESSSLWRCRCTSRVNGDTKVQSIRRSCTAFQPCRCGSCDCPTTEVGSLRYRKMLETRSSLRRVPVADPPIRRLNPSLPAQNLDLVVRTVVDRSDSRI